MGTFAFPRFCGFGLDDGTPDKTTICRFRAALINQVAGSMLGRVRSPVLERAMDYWKSIDPGVGGKIEEKVRMGSGGKPAEGMDRN